MAEHLVQTYGTTEEAESRKAEIKKAANELGLDWAELIKTPEESEFILTLDRKPFMNITVRTEETEETKVEKLRRKLYEKCGDAQTKAGIDLLIRFYIDSLGWTERRALEYAIELFENGTIEQIKIIGGNEK